MNTVTLKFPLFLKKGNNVFCVRSRKEYISIERDDTEVKLMHRCYEHTTVTALEQYLDGESEMITEVEFMHEAQSASDLFAQWFEQIIKREVEA